MQPSPAPLVAALLLMLNGALPFWRLSMPAFRRWSRLRPLLAFVGVVSTSWSAVSALTRRATRRDCPGRLAVPLGSLLFAGRLAVSDDEAGRCGHTGVVCSICSLSGVQSSAAGFGLPGRGCWRQESVMDDEVSAGGAAGGRACHDHAVALAELVARIRGVRGGAAGADGSCCVLA